MTPSIAIAPEEHRARCDGLLEIAERAGVTGVVLFDPTYVLYYSGFAFVPTERPIAFLLGPDGTRALVVPRLEVEHAESNSTLDRVEHYLEYPGDPRAEDVLARTLADMGFADSIGADQDGYPWILGYRGPTLSELAGATVVRVAEAHRGADGDQVAMPRSRSSARACAGRTSRTGSSSATHGRA